MTIAISFFLILFSTYQKVSNLFGEHVWYVLSRDKLLSNRNFGHEDNVFLVL